MRIQMLDHLFRATGQSTDEAQATAKAAFSVFIQARNEVVPYPGVHEALAELADHFRLVALTNGNADIFRTPLRAYFSEAITAADVGCKKPDPRIFQALLERCDMQSDNVIHIGDQLVDDVAGAKAIGIRAIWVNLNNAEPHVSHEADADITNHTELVSVIQQLTA